MFDSVRFRGMINNVTSNLPSALASVTSAAKKPQGDTDVEGLISDEGDPAYQQRQPIGVEYSYQQAPVQGEPVGYQGGYAAGGSDWNEDSAAASQYSSKINGAGAETEKGLPPEEPVDFVEGIDPKNRIGPWQAGWNVTNAIQGMFIVSLPYAVLHGGWWGVLALAGVAYICYYTGLLLIDCLYDEQQRRVYKSYVEVAEACWGKLGGHLVHIAQMIELLMTNILYVVLCGDLLEGCFPDAAMPKPGWMIFSCALLLSCAFLTSLKAVSWISFWNTVSHIIINAVIILYCITRGSHWVWRKVRWSLDIHTFPTVLGIVVFSYTSHIFLPTLEGAMVNKDKFKPMLMWSHLAAGVFKALFGLLGFLTFGDYTQQEVTNNLPTQEFKTIINFILVVKALLSYPLPYYATAALLETAFFKGPPQTRFPSCFFEDGSLHEWALALRVCLILFTLFMAITIPHFALLMGLIGSCTGCMLSFIWPCVFHLKLKRDSLTRTQHIMDVVIIAMGLVFGFIGIIYSAMALARAMRAVNEYA